LRNRGIDSKRRQLGENTIQAGDLVLVKEAGLPRTDWRLALVLELLPSADKLERSARIRFGRTHEETNRALEHLYPIGNVPARLSTKPWTRTSPPPTTSNPQQPLHDAAFTQPTDQSGFGPLPIQTSAASTSAHSTPNLAHTESATPSADNAQHIVQTSSPPLVAVARADHEDQDRKDQLTASSNSELGPLPVHESDNRQTTISSSSDSAKNEHDDRSSRTKEDPEAVQTPTAAETPGFGPLPILDAPKPDAQAHDASFWTRISASHAASVEQRRQRLAAAAEQRRALAEQRRLQQEPVIIPGIMLDEEQLNNDAAPVDPDFLPPRRGGDSRRYVSVAPHEALPPTEHMQRGQPIGARRNQPPPEPVRLEIPLFSASPLIDWTQMPQHLPLEEIYRRALQFMKFSRNELGNQVAKAESAMFISYPKKLAQEAMFCFHRITGVVDTSTWQPCITCCGLDEPNGFHVSVGATLIIRKDKWLKFKQIAAREDLKNALNRLMRLHIRSFGQMILLVYAARLAGDHNRMDTILSFLDGVLRARDQDYDIALVIQRHVPRMILGVDAKKHQYPSEDDFEQAAEQWCCYCYKAFVQIYECLSGYTTWSPEWLQKADIPKEFKQAIDRIVMHSGALLYNLKERIYKNYVLQRIEAAEAGETTFLWTPLEFGRNARVNDVPKDVDSRLQKWILLVDAENDYLFCSELHKDKVSILLVPSTNRADVLRFVRKILPGKDTERIYFWFGTSYINNGNTDFGALITELCHHFSTHLGHVHQYVVLPPYNRTKADEWTFDVLCLYLQRDQLLPNARVILFPYDVTLWYNDQTSLRTSGELPRWTDRLQSANGTIHNWSTVEARKYNMKTWHGSDLWTWYKRDAREKPPPPALAARIGRNGQVVQPPDNSGAFGPLPTHPGQSSEEPAAINDHPSTSTAAVVTSSEAEVSGFGPLPTQTTDAPSRSTPDAEALSNDSEAVAALLRGDNTLLETLLDHAAQKAADRMLAAFQPRLDALTRRLDALAPEMLLECVPS
ncbi:hypothetical protein AAVH_30980, partial [Aphelenchoides avenae]